jgi:threonine dehydrogenase-like Zn-dependent dehydrogenase
MKAAVTDGDGKIRLEEVPIPEPGPYQCLCKVLACATCSGTDLKIISKKLPWEEKYPGIVGHESVGRVIEVGSKVRNLKEGDLFFRPTAVYPGTKLGDYYSLWGGFAEYGLVTDTKALVEDQPDAELGYSYYQLKIPSDVTLTPADATILITMKETSGFLMSLKVTLNTALAILGAGPVAMCMCFFAKLIGAFPIIAVSRRDESLRRMERVGANFTINNQKEEVAKKVKELTGGKGVDLVIDTTGDERMLYESINLLAENGKVAPYATYSTGDPTKNIESSRIAKGMTGEVPAHNYMLDLVRLGLLKLDNFYSHRMPFSKIVDGFELLRKKEAFKIVFEMEEES